MLRKEDDTFFYNKEIKKYNIILDNLVTSYPTNNADFFIYYIHVKNIYQRNYYFFKK